MTAGELLSSFAISWIGGLLQAGVWRVGDAEQEQCRCPTGSCELRDSSATDSRLVFFEALHATGATSPSLPATLSPVFEDALLGEGDNEEQIDADVDDAGDTVVAVVVVAAGEGPRFATEVTETRRGAVGERVEERYLLTCKDPLLAWLWLLESRPVTPLLCC